MARTWQRRSRAKDAVRESGGVAMRLKTERSQASRACGLVQFSSKRFGLSQSGAA